MNNQSMKLLVLAGLAALAIPYTVFAQATTAAIVGTVTDTTGAVVPSGSVTAIQVDTNFTRTATTDNSGKYVISLLPVGNYRIEITAPGFKKFEQSGIVLDLNRT